MPIKKLIYEMPSNPYERDILNPLFRVDEALSKLVERARLSELAPAWSYRLMYRNACAAMHTQNCLIYLEDLVLLDGHAFSGAMSAELSCGLGILKFWQQALKVDSGTLLRSPMPGEMPRPLLSELTSETQNSSERPEFFFDPDWDQAGRLLEWRGALKATDQLPPLLAAGIAWDAWHVLQPEQQGTWRSTLLAALVLRARAKTRRLLVPLDTGLSLSGKRWDARQSFSQRIATFLAIADCAVKSAGAELDNLTSAKERMLLKIRYVRNGNRLPDLVDLMMSRPLVSISLAVKELGLSKQGLRVMIGRLGSSVRLITDRKRYRCWTVT